MNVIFASWSLLKEVSQQPVTTPSIPKLKAKIIAPHVRPYDARKNDEVELQN